MLLYTYSLACHSEISSFNITLIRTNNSYALHVFFTFIIYIQTNMTQKLLCMDDSAAIVSWSWHAVPQDTKPALSHSLSLSFFLSHTQSCYIEDYSQSKVFFTLNRSLLFLVTSYIEAGSTQLGPACEDTVNKQHSMW